MGSPTYEEGRGDDETRHNVRLTQGFWIMETPTTQALWESVTQTNPSHWKGANLPVENVNWFDCQDFIATLNASGALPPGLRAALPTEAQWEYACRAGATGPYGGTGKHGEMGWYYGNSDSKTRPVGEKKANAWGLRDMQGNVWEWCEDWYGAYPSGAATDPTGASSGSCRVLRGGSWDGSASYCRSANRNRFDPTSRSRAAAFGLS